MQWHPPGSTKTLWIDWSPGRPADRSNSVLQQRTIYQTLVNTIEQGWYQRSRKTPISNISSSTTLSTNKTESLKFETANTYSITQFNNKRITKLDTENVTTTTKSYPTKWDRLHGSNDTIMFYHISHFYPTY